VEGDEGVIMNGALRRIGEEAVMAYLKAFSHP
jgi:hypothetical protein